MESKLQYEFFFKTASPFSQFHPCNFVDLDNNKFNCTEQWMMYCKALLHTNNWKNNVLLDSYINLHKLIIKKYDLMTHNKNLDICNQILNTMEPKNIKAFGRKVVAFDPVLWDLIKQHVVIMGNTLKFMQNQHLKIILCNTENKIIVEASPYDKIWGIGFDKTHALDNKAKWGQNLLGKSLMVVRYKLTH